MPAPLTSTLLFVGAIVAVLSPEVACIFAGAALGNQTMVEAAAYYSERPVQEPTDGLG